MDDKEFTDRYFDVLQNIEYAIVETYRDRPELADSNVDRVLDSLARTYAAEASQRPAPPVKLSELDQELFDRVRFMCEWRLGRDEAPPKATGKGKLKPKTPDEIVACLKRVRSSVKLWTKQLGRQGYLNWIQDFIK